MVLVSDINFSVHLPPICPTLLNDVNGVKFLFGIFDMVFDFFKYRWIILRVSVKYFVRVIGKITAC